MAEWKKASIHPEVEKHLTSIRIFIQAIAKLAG
jgi:hypothetical protein